MLQIWNFGVLNLQPVASFYGTFSVREFLLEAAKWLAIFTIAIWLSIAQIAAMQHRRGKVL
jgi:hypothetical protein